MATTRSIPVFLKTQTAYVIPSEKYMIPTTWKRFHLSQLINKVLNLARPVPFDFIVQGEMLKASLGDMCAEKGFGEEETLEIEYIESLLPPEKVSSMPYPDWVSSISCQLNGHFITGSYDNSVRLFNDRQELLCTITGHVAPVSSVCFIPVPVDSMEQNNMIASASYDTTVRLVSLPDFSSPAPELNPSFKPVASLHLHTSAVSSVASNKGGTHLLTGGWDTLLGVWSTTVPDTDEVSADILHADTSERKKRRKFNGGVSKPEDGPAPRRKAPSNVLKSHTGRISSVSFSPLENEPTTAYSCGWDFTVRTWDVEVGICIGTQTVAERAMLDLSVLPNGRTLVTANADRTVSVFTLQGEPIPPTQLPHVSPVTSVVAHPTSMYHIASGSMDGTVRIWDLRSTKSAMESFLATGSQSDDGSSEAKRAPSKVLGLDWYGNLIGCAGEKGVEIFKASLGS